jgi:hypothetical protein
MGIIKSGILSELKGSVGNITGRIVNGRNILSRKPGFRKKNNSVEAIKRRDKFKLSVKLGSAVGSFDAIRLIWKTLAPQSMNHFSYFVQSNYKMIGDGVLTDKNIITPYGGFPIGTGTNTINSTLLSIVVNALAGTYEFDLETESSVKLFALIYLYNPISEHADKFTFIPVEFEAQALQLTDPITFSKALLKADQVVFESYSDHKVYAALVTTDENDNPVNYSSSICIEQL